MYEEHEVKMSPLCQTVTREGKTVKIYISDDGDGGWILEVEDEYGNSTVWDDSFETDENALKEVLDTIEKEGIESLIGTDTGVCN
jgi:hypothetical protein